MASEEGEQHFGMAQSFCVCVCVPTKYGVSALQSVRVFVLAHFIDVGTQGLDVIQLLSHNHLLMHQICLWQVGASLETHTHKKKKK